ncbi:hypothetical protein C9382_25865 [Pseudomonas aylmerensis]|uniref:Uncharacterized protein n=1 Tax=Pseudomonas aylmerensis TaxID=1869229 RepID=A0A2T4FM57_9PSED|nr:hypothetical protein C9382_25865 [Pseudomonas aylmerensis]
MSWCERAGCGLSACCGDWFFCGERACCGEQACCGERACPALGGEAALKPGTADCLKDRMGSIGAASPPNAGQARSPQKKPAHDNKPAHHKKLAHHKNRACAPPINEGRT